MPFRDWRLELGLQAASMVLDSLFPPPAPGPLIPGNPTAHWDMTGWGLLHDFGRVPTTYHGENGYAPGLGQDYVRNWPNITQGTHFNYPFSLAGHPAPNGYQWNVPEFFQNPGTNPADPVISFWHWHAYEWYGGVPYTRVSSSQTWAANPGHDPAVLPVWKPVTDPFQQPWPWPEPFPQPRPMWRVREYSKWQFDPMGRQIRGPSPLPRPLARLRPERPRPPPPKTKEKKGSMLIGTLANAFENFTEGVDAVEAIYDALPQWLRDQLGLNRDYADLWARVQALYQHWDKVDVQKAVENLLREGQSDRFVGRFHKELRDARGNLGIVTGPVIHGPGSI